MSESTHVKIPHCWKSHVVAHYILSQILRSQMQTVWIYDSQLHGFQRVLSCKILLTKITIGGDLHSLVERCLFLCAKYDRVFLRGWSVVVDFLVIITPIVRVCNCSMFCCTLLYVHS